LEAFRQVVIGKVPFLLEIDEGIRQFPDLPRDGKAQGQSLGNSLLESSAAKGLAGFLHKPMGEGPPQDLTKGRLVVLRPNPGPAGFVDQQVKRSIVG